jgi:GNAT superfamily N-acetyltransferase
MTRIDRALCLIYDGDLPAALERHRQDRSRREGISARAGTDCSLRCLPANGSPAPPASCATCAPPPTRKRKATVTEVCAAHPDDAETIARLCDEIDKFYGAPPEDPARRSLQVRQALFGSPPSAHALLAWDGANLTGLAAYSYLWPASGTSRSLYLKELYVSQAARRSGTGMLLMRALFRCAADHDCTRVEWTTDTSNLDAQAFYEALGAVPEQSKIFYRVTGADVETLASLRERH